ncbi:Hypothetical Protein FCC1311_010812 [Hondaea fermentalgiana]|uniref:Uncharacterized protein n=1 Tax=Hondaea fermentalgiana TaxID=2315210 RepID=A0A2R5G8Q3_9STRA|nr:Hypothetical Protein FCC1311_010812 [Hondaea fermentalgiana]|eukprot:GBG24863.1 Hypothetical Protein FCC1311_010812 [Hondaea fermentalgiana]
MEIGPRKPDEATKAKPAPLSLQSMILAQQARGETVDPLLLKVGREMSTIEDRIGDTSRPDWEDFKQQHMDKLGHNMEDAMEEYKRALDEEREEKLRAMQRDSSKSKEFLGREWPRSGIVELLNKQFIVSK